VVLSSELAGEQEASAAALARPAKPTPAIPTVTVPQSTPVAVPTVVIPAPTPTAAPTPRPRVRHVKKPARKQAAHLVWISAYLTSYCPGVAGWISSSGMPTFYGMLANDFYAFGTRVYLPVLGITGVVEDRIGDYSMWNHFDVWSAVCYSTPTGWYRVAIVGR
jgi:hypothetical protein